MKPLLCLVIAFGLPLAARAADEADIPLADFEGTDYGDWKADGEAFGTGPARGTLPDQMAVSGFEGKGLVNSYRGGDAAQGTLTSPEFRIERRYINFLIGGGAHPGETCIDLLLAGEVVRTATGRDSEALDGFTWDVGDLMGKTVRIRIVDRHRGGWGHIDVDRIRQSARREAEEITTAVLFDETYRPQFHFTPRRNWTNDPNGLVYYKGEYHLFFQHNPRGIVWGNMTWGHAMSLDLVHWAQIEDALEPDRMGTIFSGSAVVDWTNTAGFGSGAEDAEKPLVAIYTSAGGTSPESQGQPFTQSIAYSVDRGRTWKKYEKNPVLPHLVKENRDPKVVWHEPTKKWIMALFKDGDVYALFSSPDLKAWTHLQDISVPGCGECPDFFEMPVEGETGATRWVFTAANGHYLVGTFDGSKFASETGPHPSDRGAHFYAVQTYSDIPAGDGRRIQIAWMNGGKYPGMPFNQQMSFPCELKLRRLPEGLRLSRTPVREIETLHGKEHAFADRVLKPGENPLAGIAGDLFEIRAEIEPGDASEVGIRVRGEAVRFAPEERQVSCLGRSAPLEPEAGRVRLQVLVDRTSIEVFGNDGRASLTSCFLPRAKEKGVEVYASGGAARIVSLTVWPLRSAWPSARR